MTSTDQSLETPPQWMYTAYELDQSELYDGLTKGEYGDFTVTSLSKYQIEWQLAAHKEAKDEAEKTYLQTGREQMENKKGPLSLSAAAAHSIVTALDASTNLETELRTVAQSLTPLVVSQIVRDPRTPYHIVRAFQALPQEFDEILKAAKGATDIDEAVIANELFLRSRGPTRNKDGQGLFKLDHLGFVLGLSSKGEEASQTVSTPLTIVRKDPPKGGFEFLDNARPRQLSLQPNSTSFAETFHRITKNILKGLDWRNVFIAGGSVLTALLHTDSSKDNDAHVKEPDLDVYIYGLGPKEANEKVKHIYEIWSQNLPADNDQKLVVKNSKTITFLAKYPNRRVQIVLKLPASPTSVLLNFDLDACAIGFDGNDVLLLPRCARALETGYNTFTMDLIWGHHLSDRRASQEIRIFKYASRGFGMRILPSYVKAIETENDKEYMKRDMYVRSGEEDGRHARKPDGPEPGLKTIKRIAFLARDTVHRYFFGPTELTKKSEWEDDATWEETIEEERKTVAENWASRQEAKELGRVPPPPVIDMSILDGIKQHRGICNRGRSSIACFELWMRHCEAWRLDNEGLASLDFNSFPQNVYDPNSYDDLPDYHWNEKVAFSAKQFSSQIDEHNNNLFGSLRSSIEQKLGDNIGGPWKGYLTRRIRRIVAGPDLDTVMAKQVTMHVNIPQELENHMKTLVTSALDDSELQVSGDFLIPVHKPGMGESGTRDLPEVPGAEGNLRYWCIDNDLMWSGIDRRIDEVFEILWTMFHWISIVPYLDTEEPEYLVHFVQKYRSRFLPKLKSSSFALDDGSSNVSKPGTISDRERKLFLRWVLRWPTTIYRNYNDPPAALYDADDEIVYPPPDHLFWKAGDEGSNNGRDNGWISVDHSASAQPSSDGDKFSRKRKATSSGSD